MDGGAFDAEEEEPFELPTLEEVARATGTLCSEPIGESVTVTSRGERERERALLVFSEVVIKTSSPHTHIVNHVFPPFCSDNTIHIMPQDLLDMLTFMVFCCRRGYFFLWQREPLVHWQGFIDGKFICLT